MEERRRIVVPGETIVSGAEYLPGDYTMRDGDNVISTRFGLAEISGRLVKIIPLGGVYMPRRGNIVIGKIIDITYNGWILDINAPYPAFLSINEFGRYIDKSDITSFLDFNDVIAAKVLDVKHRSVELTIKQKGLCKLEEGMIISINPSKVPRVIGREGSMINLIKHETACEIIVGQNGLIWIKGKNIEAELLAKESIMLIVKKPFIEGLTEEVQKFLQK